MRFFKRKSMSFLTKTHFLPIFTQQTVFTLTAADALSAMMSTDDHNEWKRLEREVKQCEVQGDAMLAEFYEVLYETIIPPLDRDDMQTMALNIDRFLDQINSSAKAVLLYVPEKIDQQLVDLAQFIRDEAECLKSIMSLLDDMRNQFSAITMLCDRITELEHAADDAYEEYIGEIFRNEKNAIELMKYKNLAEELELTTDSAKKVSDHIRKLLLRYM